MNESIDINSKGLWDQAKQIYLSTLPSVEEKSQADRYLSMIISVTRKGDVFNVSTSSIYAADYLREHYAERMKKCLELVTNDKNVMISFHHDEAARPAIVVPTPPPAVSRTQRISTFVSTMPLNDEYTFDEFVRGPSNSFALAAAQAVVKNPGKSAYNPLFIHGGTGLGKTHLMQAIGNELRRRDPSLAICYLTAEEYLNEYVNYMKENNLPTFQRKYRGLDVLLIDDVQFFQIGKQIQEEFFNTFVALHQAKKQIVMTCDVAPNKLPAIEARLISRFEGGMLQEIESPSYETRLAILRKKAEVNVPPSALEFIAENIKSHVRAMEGALSKVNVFLASFPGTEPTPDILKQLLKDFIEKEQSLKKLTVEEIQNAVAAKYSISVEQILSPERTQSIVTPRQLAMYIARKFTTNSLPEIAQKFEKTHATIIHGVKTIQKRIDVESELKSILCDILSQFGYKLSDKIE